ncbi:MAG: hypothetical protein HYZ45_03825 [Burkholderiales bacterium]|nr:hypothetical protein [Burkholderiales bacterium]
MHSSIQNNVKNKLILIALASIFTGLALPAHAGNDKELAQIRDEIKQMRAAYEARMQELENRLAKAQAQNEQLEGKLAQVATGQKEQAEKVANTEQKVAAIKPAPVKEGMPNEFNPAIAMNLTATYANLSQDPKAYRLQGFMPLGDEVGPGARSFNLGESELTFSANVDPHFAGQLTFSLKPEGGAEVEEAFVETRGLEHGLKVKAGRFLSGVGYLNSVHAHAWDFVDAPLTYQAFWGGQYKNEGLQLKWLAPFDRYVEFGLEVGNGSAYSEGRNKNSLGEAALFVHAGDDWGDNASWRVGASWQKNDQISLNTGEVDLATGVERGLGRARTVTLDGVLKWAPGGNSTKTNFKLQGEYMRRTMLDFVDDNRKWQSGWYLQGVYQFMPEWRVGLRTERMNPGSVFALESFRPRKNSLMVDYSPSEFSRLRLQLAHDESKEGRGDRQIFLQYNMSLGAHAAHNF